MTKDLLRLGIRLRGSLWPEIVRVEKVGKLGDRINLGVVGVHSGKYYSKLIKEDDLKDIEALAATGMGDANEFQKAARFAEDYYLYVVQVSDDGSAEKPRIFRNPARKLDFKWMNIIQRYILEEQEWKHTEADE